MSLRWRLGLTGGAAQFASRGLIPAIGGLPIGAELVALNQVARGGVVLARSHAGVFGRPPIPPLDRQWRSAGPVPPGVLW